VKANLYLSCVRPLSSYGLGRCHEMQYHQSITCACHSSHISGAGLRAAAEMERLDQRRALGRLQLLAAIRHSVGVSESSSTLSFSKRSHRNVNEDPLAYCCDRDHWERRGGRAERQSALRHLWLECDDCDLFFCQLLFGLLFSAACPSFSCVYCLLNI